MMSADFMASAMHRDVDGGKEELLAPFQDAFPACGREQAKRGRQKASAKAICSNLGTFSLGTSLAGNAAAAGWRSSAVEEMLYRHGWPLVAFFFCLRKRIGEDDMIGQAYFFVAHSILFPSTILFAVCRQDARPAGSFQQFVA
ncbi:MAG TPA: hypothetical protein VF463_15870 [Sphingobium sp.]